MPSVTLRPTGDEYRLAEAEILRCLRVGVPSLGAARLVGGAAGLLVAFGFIALAQAEYPSHARSSLSVLATLALLALGLLLIPAQKYLATRAAAKKLYGPDSPLLQEFTLTLEAGCLRVKADGSSAEIEWRKVLRVRTVGAVTLLFIGPTHALPIPERAFSSSSDYQAFVSSLRAHATAAEA